MVWNGKGKYGVKTGRTVRNPFSHFLGREPEVLLKFTRGTENMSKYDMEQFLEENDIGDGLGDFTLSSNRHLRAGSGVHMSSVMYSLKKRKRGTLSEVFKEISGQDTSDASSRPSVTIVRRRMRQEVDADCIAVHKVRENIVYTPRKRKYTRVQDLLKKSDSTELEPEIGYELSYRYPKNEYPECSERYATSYRWSFQYSLKDPCKSRFKNKGVKNKGYRWGLYSDRELRNKEVLKDKRCQAYSTPKISESKISVMGAKWFSSFKTPRETSSPYSTGFDIGSYIDELSRHPPKKTRQKPNLRHKDGSLSQCFKYGKKSFVFIDPEPSMNTSQNPTTAPSASAPSMIPPSEKKLTAPLQLLLDDLKPEKLTEDWNGMYLEGNSLPRKFTIDLIPLLSPGGSFTNEFCCILFEMTNQLNREMNCRTVAVSLHATKTQDLSGDLYNAMKNFFVELENEKKDFWRVCDAVSCATHYLQCCYQSFLPPMQDSHSHTKIWNSIDMLGSMFGWKSEVLTRVEIKSELRAKIKKIDLLSMDVVIRTDTDDEGIAEPLEKFCGICYKEFENQLLTPFTALKHCLHTFCNECWEVHLKTQISLGNTDLQCPGHKCNVCVDKATILTLVPNWYDKFQSQKIDKVIESSSELRWCPSSKCAKVLKVSASGAMASRSNPVSVACSCGGLWCFQCGKKAHWPASCSGEEKFQEITKQIHAEIKQKGEDCITSVMVRNCPNCRYPIEKHLGCSFMFCIMCQTAFCWECLTPMSKHQEECKQKVQSKEVDLDLVSSSSNHFEEYFSIYLSNKVAQSSKVMFHQRQRLRNFDKIVKSHESLNSSPVFSFDGVVEKILQGGYKNVLRSAAEFKFYSHLTLEGAAKMAILSKSTSKCVKKHMSRLQFIMERIEEIFKCDLKQLLKNNHLRKLSRLLQHGNDCVYAIGQILSD